MLKITTTENESNSLTVHLCGQLTGEYVPELEKALQPEGAPRIALDMSNVTFVDRKAMEFLCGVKSRISIENIPPTSRAGLSRNSAADRPNRSKVSRKFANEFVISRP